MLRKIKDSLKADDLSNSRLCLLRKVYQCNMLKVGFVFGLAVLVVAAGVFPAFGLSVVDTDTDDISYRIGVESEDIVGSDMPSSEKTLVFVYKLTKSGFIQRVPKMLSKAEIEEYTEKLMSCDTLKDKFDVLQEYDIVPESMTFDSFSNYLDKKIELFNFLKKKNNHDRNMESLNDGFEYIEEWLCIAYWKLYPVSFNVCLPLIYYEGEAPDHGGEAECRGQNISSDTYFWVQMAIYLGILKSGPYISLTTASFIGFCGYFYACT